METTPFSVEQTSYELHMRSDPTADYVLWSKTSVLAPRPAPDPGRPYQPEFDRLSQTPAIDLRPFSLDSFEANAPTHTRRSSPTIERSDDLDRATIGELLGAYQALAPGHRPVASAGGLYPLDLYFLARSEGAWALSQYEPLRHAELVLDPDFGDDRRRSLLLQEDTHGAALCVFAVFNSRRNSWKYGPRALKYALIECGGLFHEMGVRANALGLRCCIQGAVDDISVEDALGLDGIDASLQGAMLFGSHA